MFPYVEFGGSKNKIFYRNKWLSDQRALDVYIKEFNNTDIYLTVWRYKEPDFESKCDAPLYFDIDNKDLEKSRKDTITLCNILMKDFFIPYCYMDLRFTGNKGFHLLVNNKLFGISEHINKAKLWRHLAITLQKHISSIDTQIYDTRRLFRITNSINGKSGLYKIPIVHSELKEKMNWVVDKAKEERTILLPQLIFEENPQSHEAIMKVWESIPKNYNRDYKPPCIEAIGEGVEKGELHDALFTLAIYLKNLNFDRDKIFKILVNWNNSNNPKIALRDMGVTINSIMSKEYSVGCSTPILQKYCNKKECKIK